MTCWKTWIFPAPVFSALAEGVAVKFWAQKLVEWWPDHAVVSIQYQRWRYKWSETLYQYHKSECWWTIKIAEKKTKKKNIERKKSRQQSWDRERCCHGYKQSMMEMILGEGELFLVWETLLSMFGIVSMFGKLFRLLMFGVLASAVLGNHPQGNQEPLMVKDKIGRPQVSWREANPWKVILLPSVLVERQEGHLACRKLSVGLLIVMISGLPSRTILDRTYSAQRFF